MIVSTPTPEGEPRDCPVCGKSLVIETSTAITNGCCPNCGGLWWATHDGLKRIYGLHRFLFSDGSIRTKQQAIAAILDRLVECAALTSSCRDGVLAALLAREELGSTGIGRGVAIPHAKYPGLPKVTGAIVRFTAGIDFDSLDRQPVHLVGLVVSPTDRPGEHLRVLEGLSRFLRDSL